MATVATALGPAETSDLGPTLMHEHIVTRSPGVPENWPHLWDRPGILAVCKAGVPEDQMDQMLVCNPRAIFEGRPS